MPTTAPLELLPPEQLRARLGLPEDIGEGDPWADAIDQIADAAARTLLAYLKTDQDHAGHPACRAAAMQVGIDLWQAETAAGGSPVTFDGTPSPYRLSRFIIGRVDGLLGPCRAVGSLIG